jgi:hypothetical protein
MKTMENSTQSSPEQHQSDWPDPWPKKGWTNKEWAEELLHNLYSPDYMGYGNSIAYLARALDIACMHSVRPVDRYVDELADKLLNAARMVNSVSMQGSSGITFAQECERLVEKVRSFKG